MNKLEIDRLVAEDILGKNEASRIKLDDVDVLMCTESADKVDALKVVTTLDKIDTDFPRKFESVINQNLDYVVDHILFRVLDSPYKKMKMGNLKIIFDVINPLGEDVDVIWGNGIDDDLMDNQISIVVLFSFKKK